MGESFLMRRGGAVVRVVTAGVVVDMVSVVVLRRFAGGEVGGDVMFVCWSIVGGIVWWWLWLRLEEGVVVGLDSVLGVGVAVGVGDLTCSWARGMRSVVDATR